MATKIAATTAHLEARLARLNLDRDAIEIARIRTELERRSGRAYNATTAAAPHLTFDELVMADEPATHCVCWIAGHGDLGTAVRRSDCLHPEEFDAGLQVATSEYYDFL